MSNQQLFKSYRGAQVAPANARNEAGGAAYLRSAEAALALYAATGCLNGTFYADARSQLDTVLGLCEQVSAQYVGKLALYAREQAYMKDMPTLLLAYLSIRDGEVLEQVFERVIDNGRMLRNFVQILRSGVLGRKSLGTRPKRLVQQWLQRASVARLISAAVGEQPSLADVIRMVHPQPQDAERAALYAWLIGKPCAADRLPALVREFEAFKREPSGEVPDLPFQYLTAMPLSTAQWQTIAARSSWQTTRMNLNTFLRKGVFEDPALVSQLAAKLADARAIARARVLPYQLMVSYRAAAPGMPPELLEALQDALEIATRAVPVFEGKLVLAIDVSGSMSAPITGYRKGANSVASCVEVAALLAACIKRSNPRTQVLPFAGEVRPIKLNPRDSVLSQAQQLAALLGGGTCVSAPLKQLNQAKQAPDLLIIVSDNQSWLDTRGAATETMRQWAELKARNPKAKMVCIDLQPYATTQAPEAPDVWHLGGFSDAVFGLLHDVLQGGEQARWVRRVERMNL